MGLYSSEKVSIVKISHDFQEEDKELNSQELSFPPLLDLGKSHHLLNVYDTCQNRIFYIYVYIYIHIYIYILYIYILYIFCILCIL